MGSKAPPGHAPQHLQALERANEVRHARASLKRKIANGDVSVQQVLVACPSHAATMSIGDLLMSQRWWGKKRCRRLLLSIGISEGKPVGNLTERQRTTLAALLAMRTGLQTSAIGHSRPCQRTRRVP
jgi:hypothetical protein